MRGGWASACRALSSSASGASYEWVRYITALVDFPWLSDGVDHHLSATASHSVAFTESPAIA